MRQALFSFLILTVLISAFAEKPPVIQPEEKPIAFSSLPSRIEGSWTVQNPLVQGNFNGIWYKSGDERYIVGDKAQILHYRYGTWALVKTTEGTTYNSVWGLGNEVFAVGTRSNVGIVTKYDPTTDTWEDVVDPIVAAGNVYYRVQASETNGLLYVLGESGGNPYVIFYNGSAWAQTAAGLPPGTIFRGLDVVESTGIVYVAGDGGSVWNYNGSWTNMSVTATAENLNGVIYVDASTTVWAVGDNRTWVNVTTDTLLKTPWPGFNYHLSDVWFDGTDKYYATCKAPVNEEIPASIIKYNGTSTSTLIFDDDNASFNDIHGFSVADFCAVGNGGKILNYSAGWIWLHRSFVDTLYAIWGFGKSAYAAGDRGCILKYNGTAWSRMISAKDERFYGIWGADEKNIYAVGRGGTILKFDGNIWTEQNSTTTQALYGVWGVGTNVFAVGANGTILKGGTAWAQVSTGNVVPAIDLYGIWGSSATNIYVVGAPYNDKDPNTQEPINVNGIFRFDGAKWYKVDVTSGIKDFPTTTWRGVWCGSATDVYVVGDTVLDAVTGINMNMLHSNATGWRSNLIGYNDLGGGIYQYTDLYGVFWGVPGKGGFLVGLQKQSDLLTYRQSKLFLVNDVGENPEAREMDNPRSDSELQAVWGSAAMDVFAVGEDGAILHYDSGMMKHNFDRNGKADIVVRKKLGATAEPAGSLGDVRVWYMNDNTIIKDIKLTQNAGDTTAYLGTGNFDGNGLNDHLWANLARALDVDIWFHQDSTIDNGTVVKKDVNIPNSSGSVVGIGHFNRDGKSDIMSKENNLLYIAYMDGARVVSNTLIPDPGHTFDVLGIGHFDSNGISDILIQKPSGAPTAYEIWYMDKDEVLLRMNILPPATTGNWEVLGIGDFDSNGLDDVLWRNKTNAQVWVGFNWLGQQQPTYLALQKSPGSTYQVAEIADFNGDGYDDILWKNGTALDMWKIKGQVVLATALIAFPTGYTAANWEVVNK